MINRKISLSIITSVVVVPALLILVTGAFAGGVVLAPYVNSNAQAAMLPESNSATQSITTLTPTDSDVIGLYEQALVDLYEDAVPSVVHVQVTQKVDQQSDSNQFGFPSPFFRPFQEPFAQLPRLPEEFYNRGQGSGFVWDEEGHIVTNYHVVENASHVEVKFADGNTVEAEVLGIDADSDLAVLKVDPLEVSLHPVRLGDSDRLKVGQLAVAIGNPFDQEFTMTTGIVSAVDRTIRSGNSFFSIPHVIQTDAPINPGNSGGPLLNRHGEVIGINSQIISRSGANAGIGFAIPINIAKQIVPTLIQGENFEYAWLGITGTTLTTEVADFMKLPKNTKGALVINVTQDSPADRAGLQGSDKTLKVNGVEYQLGGDVITAINDQPVEDMDDLVTYLIEETRPGDDVTLSLIHPDGEEETVEVSLEVRPSVEEMQPES